MVFGRNRNYQSTLLGWTAKRLSLKAQRTLANKLFAGERIQNRKWAIKPAIQSGFVD
jgi:hypothetical protein